MWTTAAKRKLLAPVREGKETNMMFTQNWWPSKRVCVNVCESSPGVCARKMLLSSSDNHFDGMMRNIVYLFFALEQFSNCKSERYASTTQFSTSSWAHRISRAPANRFRVYSSPTQIDFVSWCDDVSVCRHFIRAAHTNVVVRKISRMVVEGESHSCRSHSKHRIVDNDGTWMNKWLITSHMIYKYKWEVLHYLGVYLMPHGVWQISIKRFWCRRLATGDIGAGSGHKFIVIVGSDCSHHTYRLTAWYGGHTGTVKNAAQMTPTMTYVGAKWRVLRERARVCVRWDIRVYSRSSHAIPSCSDADKCIHNNNNNMYVHQRT